MNNDYIQRYIYAVTKGLPSKMRKDIESELNSLIEDMLESRCGEFVPTERDIRVVLAELGTPTELAEKYRLDGEKYLIGPSYYSKYKTVLFITLAATVFGMAVAGLLDIFASGEMHWYRAFPQWISTIVGGLMTAFTIVTLVFVFFEHRGIPLNLGTDSIDQLPPVPVKKEIISKWEVIAGIIFSLAFVVAFWVVSDIFAVIAVDKNRVVPIFDSDILRKLQWVILAFFTFGIIGECVKLHEGRYTKRLARATVGINLISALLPLDFS